MVGQQSNRCLGINNTILNGTDAQLRDCHGGENQSWNNTSRKRLVVYGNKCLDAYNRGTTDGARVVIRGLQRPDRPTGERQLRTLDSDGCRNTPVQGWRRTSRSGGERAPEPRKPSRERESCSRLIWQGHSDRAACRISAQRPARAGSGFTVVNPLAHRGRRRHRLARWRCLPGRPGNCARRFSRAERPPTHVMTSHKGRNRGLHQKTARPARRGRCRGTRAAGSAVTG
ncbi:ricin-type beta-trefoil lectin domain protein, partial [Streptomyces dysideae]|uniref:ricin-type beta-trefoil lectin domain protein n=1 Tax=Streptomyces dysideae TaxID=909626 RepID=UPI001F1D031A